MTENKSHVYFLSVSDACLFTFPTSACRSSIDDYCPQDQVEAIQEAMMEVLTDVYKEIDVSKLYEQQQ